MTNYKTYLNISGITHINKPGNYSNQALDLTISGFLTCAVYENVKVGVKYTVIDYNDDTTKYSKIYYYDLAANGSHSHIYFQTNDKPVEDMPDYINKCERYIEIVSISGRVVF